MYVPSLLLIAEAVFLLEHGQTGRQTDATKCPITHAVGDAGVGKYNSLCAFKCSFDHAKLSFYRAVNGIFGKMGRCASEEEVVLQLVNSKCIPALLYVLEASFEQDRSQILRFISQPLFYNITQKSKQMIYRPLRNVNRILVFNCLVLDFPKDQKDMTISIPLFIVLCFDMYSSLLVPCFGAGNYAFMFFCVLRVIMFLCLILPLNGE